MVTFLAPLANNLSDLRIVAHAHPTLLPLLWGSAAWAVALNVSYSSFWLPMTSGGHRSGDITTGCPRPDADHDPVMGLALPAAFGMPLGGWWVVHGCHPDKKDYINKSILIFIVPVMLLIIS